MRGNRAARRLLSATSSAPARSRQGALVGGRERFLTTVLPGVALLVIPGIFWASAFGSATNAGGDVPNILFLHPLEFLRHVGFTSTDNGLAGYNQFVTYDSLALVALALRTLHLNAELAVSGALLALTYVGVQRLVLELAVPKHSKAVWRAACFAGVVAVTAPVISQTFWTAYEPRMYLTALAPWLVVFSARYITSGRFGYVLAAGGACALGSAALVDIPGSVPTFGFYVVAVAVTAGRSLTSRTGVVRVGMLVAFVAALNAYWIVPFVEYFVRNGAQAAYATSTTGASETIQVVHALAPYQSLLDALSLQLSHHMMVSFGWSQLHVSGWVRRLTVIGFLPVLCILLGPIVAFVLTPSRWSIPNALPYGVFACVFVIMLGFFSLRLPGSVAVFDELARTVPGWPAVRNFFNAFAVPYTLGVAVAAALGLAMIADFDRPRWVSYLPYAGAAVFAVYGAQLLAGDYFRLPYYPGFPATRVLSAFPADYEAVADQIDSNDPVLTLPLNTTTWSYLTGPTRSGTSVTYVGISPLYFLYGLTDYNGVPWFTPSTDPRVQIGVEHAVETGEVSPLIRLISAVGIRWIIDETIDDPTGPFSRTAAAPTAQQEASETTEIMRGLRTRVAAISGAYSLHEVIAPSHIPRISIDRTTPLFRNHNALGQIAAGTYSGPVRKRCSNVEFGPASLGRSVQLIVTSPIADRRCAIVIRSAYSGSLHAVVQQGATTYHVNSTLAYGFANGFVLPRLAAGPALIRIKNDSTRDWSLSIAVSDLALLAAAGTILRQLWTSRTSSLTPPDSETAFGSRP